MRSEYESKWRIARYTSVTLAKRPACMSFRLRYTQNREAKPVPVLFVPSLTVSLL